MAKLRTLKEYHKKAIENPAYGETALQLTAGAASYSGTRVVGKIAYGLGAKKSPLLGKISYVGSNVILLLAIYFILKKFEKLEKYQNSILIGTAIANLQAIIQTVAPKYYWLLSDPGMNKKFPVATSQIGPIRLLNEEEIYEGEEVEDIISSPQQTADSGDALEEYDLSDYESSDYAGSLA